MVVAGAAGFAGAHVKGFRAGIVGRHAEAQDMARQIVDPGAEVTAVGGKQEMRDLGLAAGHIEGGAHAIPQLLPGHVGALQGDLGIDRGMERDGMHLIDRVLGALQPIAMFDEGADRARAILAKQQIVARQRRRRIGAEIGEDQTRDLFGGIGGLMHLVGERAIGRFGRHLDAAPVGGEFPAMIAAADPVGLDTAEFERGAAMRAGAIEQADAARSGAKQNEILAQDAHRLRTVRQGFAETRPATNSAAAFCRRACRDRRGSAVRFLPGSCVPPAGRFLWPQ